MDASDLCAWRSLCVYAALMVYEIRAILGARRDLFRKTVLGLNYEVRGLEHLPADQNCIIASKHMSTYETFKIHILFKDAAVILKRELFWIPIWGAFLKKSDVIAIDRGNHKQAIASINRGQNALPAKDAPS